MKSYDKVVAAIAQHEKTITLSVGQLTTGITIDVYKRQAWNRIYIQESLEQAYEKCFGQALMEYNARLLYTSQEN